MRPDGEVSERVLVQRGMDVLCGQGSADGWPDIGDADRMRSRLPALIAEVGLVVAAKVVAQVFDEEFKVLIWAPVAGARFVRAALEATPSPEVLRYSVAYLGMYFQELDDVVAVARSQLSDETRGTANAVALIAAIDGLAQ